MINEQLLPCPMCGGSANIRVGKQYKILLQSWHTSEEEKHQPCEVVCSVCGLRISRSCCNADYGGANKASKQARINVMEVWNNRYYK